MGNCLRRQSAERWGGDDWDFEESQGLFKQEMGSNKHIRSKNLKGEKENESLLREKNGISSTEVKIKLSKKQMEELLAKVGFQGVTIEQVLTQLVNNGSAGDCQLRHRSWRPALQSIPEVN